MKKTVFFILLTLTMTLMLVSCQTHRHNYVDGICTECDDVKAEPTADEYFIFTELADGSYSIAAKDITELPDVVIIPSTYNGKPVTVVAEGAFKETIKEDGFWLGGIFYGQDSVYFCTIKTVVIPESVTRIENEAFKNCTHLTKVIMGDSVTHIGNYAFMNCKFKTIDLSESLTHIGEYAFMSAIEVVVLPDSLTTIAPYAFASSNLTTITIPKSVKEIGNNAFTMCDLLCEVVNNSSVELGYLPPSVLEVHSGESKIVNKNGYLFYKHDGKNLLVRYIGNETDLALPPSFNGEDYDIHNLAFANCYKITSIVIPEGVKEIGSSAFFMCESLEEVYLPKSITTLHTSYGSNLFPECISLKEVHYAGSEADGMAITIIPPINYADMTYTFEDVTKAEIHYNSTKKR